MTTRCRMLAALLFVSILAYGCGGPKPTPTPSPTPTVPPPESGSLSGQIVFSSNRGGNLQIYVMNADGTGVRRLTSDPGGAVMPTWSPDGKHIVFVSRRSGRSDIYVMDADGSNLRRQTDDRAEEMGPDWRP